MQKLSDRDKCFNSVFLNLKFTAKKKKESLKILSKVSCRVTLEPEAKGKIGNTNPVCV